VLPHSAYGGSLEQAVAALCTTRQLAVLGAESFRVERPYGGDFARADNDTVQGPC